MRSHAIHCCDVPLSTNQESYGIIGGELLAIQADDTADIERRYRIANEALPYAQLSAYIYEDDSTASVERCRNIEVSNAQDEWIKCQEVRDSILSLGAHVALYRNALTRELVIVVEGSCGDGFINIDCSLDLIGDLANIVGSSPQDPIVDLFVIDVMDNGYERYGGIPSIITGHSLGGGIAQTLASAWGLTAYTFNTASVSRFEKALIGQQTSARHINLVNEQDVLEYIRNITQAERYILERNLNLIFYKFPATSHIDAHNMCSFAKNLAAVRRLLQRTP